MLASSFLDPVLGIDVHFEMVPMPAPVPTPIPNPFIGVVFDPLGLGGRRRTSATRSTSGREEDGR